MHHTAAKTALTTPAAAVALALRTRPEVAAGLVAVFGLFHGAAHGANPAALRPLADWTRDMTDFWNARIDALEDLLKRMDQ